MSDRLIEVLLTQRGWGVFLDAEAHGRFEDTAQAVSFAQRLASQQIINGAEPRIRVTFPGRAAAQ